MTSNAITAILSLSFINISQDFPEIHYILLTSNISQKDLKKLLEQAVGG
jgi:hypothetical protein